MSYCLAQLEPMIHVLNFHIVPVENVRTSGEHHFSELATGTQFKIYTLLKPVCVSLRIFPEMLER